MHQKVKKWGIKILAIGILVALMPCATTWAAHKPIPRSRNNNSLKDYHGLGIEFSCSLPPYGWFTEKKHAYSTPKTAPIWSLGCVYGYAWAQRGDSWWMPEIGVKYGLKRRSSSRFEERIIIKEPSLYIPLSINLLSTTPEWEGSSAKFVLGIGYEATVALSSYCFLEGEDDSHNLLKNIPALSRFSGSFFMHFKVTIYRSVYLSLVMKLPANISALKHRDDWNWYPRNQTINKSHVEAFRIDTTSFIDLGLGLDLLPLFED